MELQNTKYYTPSIEEFHVGFQYEWLEDYTGEWTKEVININTPLTYFRDDADVEHRVKYLDKEDIESLGFKQTVHTVYKISKNSFKQVEGLEEYTKDGNLMIIIDTNDNNILTIKKLSGIKFIGTVKNKSELIKLIKQISIDGRD